MHFSQFQEFKICRREPSFILIEWGEAQWGRLQVLQDRIVQRVGGDETTSIDVRIIAATNSDLGTMCATNRFRTDLFYRLNVFPIEVPSLRDRIEDIPFLLHSFLDRLNALYKKNITSIDPIVQNALASYSWPGNVREMENLIERAFIKEKTSVITPKSIPIDLIDLIEGRKDAAPFLSIADLTLAEVRNSAIEKIEKQYLKTLLTKFHGKINDTAEAAGVSSRQVGKLMQKYELKKEKFKNIND